MKGKTKTFKAAPSAMEAAKDAPKPKQGCTHGGQCFGACPDANPQTYVKEHDTMISRNTGKPVEIKFGPQSNGLVPANPFASLAQAGYMHSHPEILGKKGLAEWDSTSKGKSLPGHVKK